MARRSSARLRNRNSSTPKRVSLSHDATTHTPRTAPVKLQTLREYEEMPGAFPGSVSPPTVDVNKHATKVPPNFKDSTPMQSTPVKPAAEEMSPKHHQQSTAKPMEEARWLGFSNMAPHTEPVKQSTKIAMLQGTPTKASKSGNEPASPRFRFTFGREQSLELSPDAKKLMSEKREEALKIREQMVASGEGPQDYADLKTRKFATPKGKRNRFSDVHLEQFEKMDSIAGHASAFRADRSKLKAATTPVKPHEGMQASSSVARGPLKSLKRSPSKAGFFEAERPDTNRSQSHATPTSNRIQIDPSPAASSHVGLNQTSSDTPSAKRFKRADTDDDAAAAAERSVGDTEKSIRQTPQPLKQQKELVMNSSIASPTQASLARGASVKRVKTSKIPGPVLPVSTPKAMLEQSVVDATKPSTPLLARTPSKAPLFFKQSVDKPRKMLSPLLMRTPSKLSPFKKAAAGEDKAEQTPEKAPLLSRSPFKMSKDQSGDPGVESQGAQLRSPLLARTPVKLAMSREATDTPTGQKPSTAHDGTLMGRFNLLRSSPMKSILRSPQRLYSNDPAKIAAGTHLASPATAAEVKNHCLSQSPGGGTPLEKHVDFTSSTKARYERAQSELESTSSEVRTPEPKNKSHTNQSPKAVFANYPALPTDEAEATPNSPKRRQTAAPGDFTFTSHGREIVFGKSPSASEAAKAAKDLPSTIRHVSAEPQRSAPGFPIGESKKRKFDSANEDIAKAKEVEEQEKENQSDADSERPAKRIKSSVPEPPAAKLSTRPPTLGVKPKKNIKDGRDKKPSVISRARLNALAQPKRKG